MSDIIELKGKIEEAAKALHDERKHYEELKAEQAKGRISEAELKERIEKLEKMTDKVEDQKSALEKMQATIQRIGNGAEESSEGKIDSKAMNQAIRTLLKTGARFDRNALHDLPEAEKKALSNSINEDGGFRVMAERDSELGRIIYDTSNLRAVARVVSIGSNRYEKVSKDTTAGASWASEIATRSASDNSKTFLTEIPVHEIYSWQDVTEQHMEDAGYDVLAETSFDAAEEIGLE
jgi:HK97 family phage major capsid protein